MAEARASHTAGTNELLTARTVKTNKISSCRKLLRKGNAFSETVYSSEAFAKVDLGFQSMKSSPLCLALHSEGDLSSHLLPWGPDSAQSPGGR